MKFSKPTMQEMTKNISLNNNFRGNYKKSS